MDGDVVVEYNELNINENAAPFWLTPDEVNFVGPYKMENRLYQLEEEADQLRAQLDALDSEKDNKWSLTIVSNMVKAILSLNCSALISRLDAIFSSCSDKTSRPYSILSSISLVPAST